MTYESNGAHRQHYQCGNCGAFDSLILFAGEQAPPATQCNSCGSGRKEQTISDMGRFSTGMRPVTMEWRNENDKTTSPKDRERLGLTPINLVGAESNDTVTVN